MFKHVRVPWSMLCMVAMVAVSALPAAAQSASTMVTIGVLPVQQVEGATSLVIPAGASSQQGQLIVKSNTPWVLIAHASSAGAVVAWKTVGGSVWQRLTATTPVLNGLKGVHQVEYEVRVDGAVQGQPVTVTFSIEPATAR